MHIHTIVMGEAYSKSTKGHAKHEPKQERSESDAQTTRKQMNFGPRNMPPEKSWMDCNNSGSLS